MTQTQATYGSGSGPPRLNYWFKDLFLFHTSARRVDTDWSYKFQVVDSPEDFSTFNRIGINPSQAKLLLVKLGMILLDGKYAVSPCVFSHKFPPGTIGLSKSVRSWGNWSVGQEVLIEPYEDLEPVIFGRLELLVCHAERVGPSTLNHVDAVAAFKKLAMRQVVQPTQTVTLDLAGILYQVTVTSATARNRSDGSPYSGSKEVTFKGRCDGATKIRFRAPKEYNIAITDSPKQKSLIKPHYKLEDLGIGGLDAELQEIELALSSRTLDPDWAEMLDFKHCKGIILHGPPGTGKTLIARKLSQMLNCREPKIVNGPAVMTKYVGDSAKNIRDLFEPAKKEYKEKGDDSELHVIIIDELDSVCRHRSGNSEGSGARDDVVNQLLAEMDGVEELNNILIIGMTNRLDLIDSALLRPGRFQVKIKIDLPDEKGRKDILLIQTAILRLYNVLAADVDLDYLAARTRNFSGAELEGLCTLAKLHAIRRRRGPGPLAQIDENTIESIIENSDFMLALSDSYRSSNSRTTTRGGVRGLFRSFSRRA